MGHGIVENMSHRQRSLTPLPFAKYLLESVLGIHGSERVAVLWAAERSLYGQLWPVATCWTKRRNARLYEGPWPVICHPPCGPWGKYRAKCHQSKQDGILAMEFVHRYGGVVEQPVGSQLFKLHGKGGRIEQVRQSDYGHKAPKETLLYWIDKPSREE